MAGWSSRVIGEESTRSARPGSPASTGQVCRLRQAATASLAHSGGSVIERNAPASRWSRVWPATSECGSAASRSPASSGRRELVFSTTTRSRRVRYGPSSSVVETRTTPLISSRRRTRRPTGRPSVTGSVSSAAARVNGKATSAPVGSATGSTKATFSSRPSSQGTRTRSSRRSSRTVSYVPSARARWTTRRWVCRKRNSTASAAPRFGSIRHSVCWAACSPAAAHQAGGTSTPNCQRSRFLAADARYG